MNRTTRIFFYSVYAVLGLIWITTVAVPTWRPAGMEAPFTVLILLSGILHALLERLEARGWAVPYLAAQTALAAALLWIGDGAPMVEALFAPIAGEAVGLFPDWRRRGVALAGILGAFLATMLLTGQAMVMLVRLPWTGAAFGFAALYVVLYVRQVSERERAESLVAQLQEAHEQVRRYAEQIQEMTITQERQRMARELHDTLAQGLAGLVMQLEAVDELLGRGEAERARTLVLRAMERTRRTLAEARARIQSLRLPVDRLDLAAELRRELERVKAEAQVETSLEVGPGEPEAQGESAAQLYYIAREGLANAVRHARASRVDVRLWAEGDRICMSITDDGVGFDPAAVGGPGHFGLTGARERARSVGGELMIESRRGEGCRLVAAVPREPAQDHGGRVDEP